RYIPSTLFVLFTHLVCRRRNLVAKITGCRPSARSVSAAASPPRLLPNVLRTGLVRGDRRGHWAAHPRCQLSRRVSEANRTSRGRLRLLGLPAMCYRLRHSRVHLRNVG